MKKEITPPVAIAIAVGFLVLLGGFWMLGQVAMNAANGSSGEHIAPRSKSAAAKGAAPLKESP